MVNKEKRKHKELHEQQAKEKEYQQYMEKQENIKQLDNKQNKQQNNEQNKQKDVEYNKQKENEQNKQKDNPNNEQLDNVQHNDEHKHKDKDQNKQNGLQSANQLLQSHFGNTDTSSQTQAHDRIGHDSLRAEQRHNIQHHHQNLGAGIQLMSRRISGEILTQRNIFQHTPPPFLSASRRLWSSSTV